LINLLSHLFFTVICMDNLNCFILTCCSCTAFWALMAWESNFHFIHFMLALGSIDGQTSLSSRQESIKEYNRAESEIFIFLMSTRAGGLGVDLLCILILSILVLFSNMSLVLSYNFRTSKANLHLYHCPNNVYCVCSLELIE